MGGTPTGAHAASEPTSQYMSPAKKRKRPMMRSSPSIGLADCGERSSFSRPRTMP